ncbi:MAG TPA: alpha-L-fucosidase [Rhodanobacter sp.]|nr:alpha-L-fucosidase [Rhodanobacter sp.]
MPLFRLTNSPNGLRHPVFAGCLLIAFAVTSFPVRAAQPSDNPDAPTAVTLSPAQMDRAWQRATARYEPARKALLAQVAQGDAIGPFRPDWISLAQYRAPAWFGAAKFGIFIHWGAYAVPAFASEWYPRKMYDSTAREHAHQVATYGPLAQHGYKDFIAGFKAQHWDPASWARLFRQAGARYVVEVAEHSDGFAMYDSRLSRWTAANMGPKRDVVAALERAVRAEGIRFGLSSHRAEHSWFFDQGRELASDVNDPAYVDLYGPAVPHFVQNGYQDLGQDWTYVSPTYVDDWLARTAELEAYYKPDLVYLDWWVGHPAFRDAVAEFAAYYYNRGAQRGGVVLNYKLHAMPSGSGVQDVERGQLGAIQATPWQTDTTISNSSWGYVEHDTYRSAASIIRLLADVVSKNGNLLLDIGPRPDGSIVPQERAVLLDIGRWLATNGAAIYGSHPWRVFGEGPTEAAAGAFNEKLATNYTAADFRFTRNHDTVYAIELAWPDDGTVVIHSIKPNDRVQDVRLLGSPTPVRWQSTAQGLVLHPGARPAGPAAFVFAIRTAGDSR